MIAERADQSHAYSYGFFRLAHDVADLENGLLSGIFFFQRDAESDHVVAHRLYDAASFGVGFQEENGLVHGEFPRVSAAANCLALIDILLHCGNKSSEIERIYK